MAVLDVIIGYVRGLKGDTGATGATGATGPGATIGVGTVTTTTYGNPAQVTNSGTATDAVLNFVIPQGAPGEEVTDVSSLTLDSVTSTAASFPIPAVGEVMSVIMGKIIKFFGDTVTALNSKLNRSDVTTSLGVTTTGQALDATAGKTLNDSISALNDSLALAVKAESALGISDANIMSTERTLTVGRYTAESLNTPYKAGLTENLSEGIILNYGGWVTGSGFYASQLAMSSGGYIYERHCKATVWSAWQRL